METKKESNITVTPQQIADLARPFVGMVDRLKAFYDDPEYEREFQEWYLKEYGHPAPKDV